MTKADKIFIDMCQDILDKWNEHGRGKSKTALGRRNKCLYDQKVWRGKSVMICPKNFPL